TSKVNTRAGVPARWVSAARRGLISAGGGTWLFWQNEAKFNSKITSCCRCSSRGDRENGPSTGPLTSGPAICSGCRRRFPIPDLRDNHFLLTGSLARSLRRSAPAQLAHRTGLVETRQQLSTTC